MSSNNWFDILSLDSTKNVNKPSQTITFQRFLLSRGHSEIENRIADKKAFFKYILDFVEFWYFDTSKSEQGEELYIFMNARGEQVQMNENLKADLLGKLNINDPSAILVFEREDYTKGFKNNLVDLKNYWGKKWEQWQDYFWQERDKTDVNSNADNGFNEFLRWIQIIQMTELKLDDIDNKDDETPAENINEIIKLIQLGKVQLKTDYFTLELIENYFLAVSFIFNEYPSCFEKLELSYPNLSEFDLLPNRLLHPNKGYIEQIECFKLLPVVYYCKSLIERQQGIDFENLFRLIRFLNNISQDITITKTVNKQVINGLKLIKSLLEDYSDIADVVNLDKNTVSASIITVEECFKFIAYKSNQNRKELEGAFWTAEDNKLNKGKIGHLIQAAYFNAENIDNFEYSEDFELDEAIANLFPIENFLLLSNRFAILTENKQVLSSNIWSLLLLTDFYIYNSNANCISCKSNDDRGVIQNANFLKLLFLYPDDYNITEYFTHAESEFFKVYQSIDDVRKEQNYNRQLYLYQFALRTKDLWDWSYGRNFGVIVKNDILNFDCFFNSKFQYQHYRKQWRGADYNFFDQSPKLIEDALAGRVF